MICHVIEGVEVTVALLPLAEALAVEEQFHLVGCRDDIYRLDSARLVVPVPDDVCPGFLWLHPATPHHLVGKEGILGNTHGIGDAARSVVRFAAVVGVGVREHNLHTAAADAGASARALLPVVIPAAYHLNGKLVHVVVVFQGRLATVERSVAFLVVGIALFVPVFAQSLVAAVFHGPHRVLFALVDVKHLAAVFCLVDVEHLTAADSSSTKGVVLVAYLLHFHHVLSRNTLVAALVEEDGGVVAVVDDGVTHQFRALLPAGTFHVLLGITGRHGLDETHAVARLDVLLPRGDVHPAYQIAAGLNHQVVAVVAEPCRHADAHAWPFVGRALGIAMHHQYAVVEPDLTFGESCLAESRACGYAVNGGTVDHKVCLYRIQIPITP